MLFSIIIPLYKNKYLRECIDSILSQTYMDFELILVNDASPFDLDSIVSSYKDNRIKYYSNKEGYGAYNMVDNWNHCLEYATGKYVICMGDDDKLKPNCLKDYVQLIENNPDLDLYHTRLEFIDENSEVFSLQEDRPDRESVYSMIWHFWKGRRQVIGDWLFKTSTLRERGGFYYLPCAWGSDDLSAFIAAKEKGVANTHEPGFQYRESRHSVSNSNTYAFEKVSARRQIEQWYHDFFEKEPNTYIDKLYRSLLKKDLSSMTMRKIRLELMIDFNNNPSHIWQWLKQSGKFGLTKRYIISVFLYALKGRIKFISKNRKEYG